MTGDAQSAGGAAGAGGFGFQDYVGAYLAVYAVAGARAPLPWQLPFDAIIEHLASETGEHTDDWRIITSAQGCIFVQAKRTISNSDSAESEIAKVWTQFINQYRAGVGQDSRQLERPRDRIVLVVGENTPATVRVHLREVLSRARGLAPSDPLERAARNREERTALTAALTLIRQIWSSVTGSPPNGDELRSFLALVQIERLQLDEGAPDCGAIKAILANAVLQDPRKAPAAWFALCHKARELATGRAGADRMEFVERLRDTGCQVRDPFELDIAGTAAGLLAVGRRPWSDLYPPSALLDANYCVVPFRARLAERMTLERWCADESAVLVRLYTGPGGMGKTRLMIDFIDHLTQAAPGGRWRAGFLSRQADVADSAVLDHLMEYPDRLFAAVDYADIRRDVVIAMLTRAAKTRPGRRLRIVLLARDALDWWRLMKRHADGVGYLLQGRATIHEELAPFSLNPAERTQAFLEACRAFAVHLGLTVEGITPPDLSASDYDRILLVHMAAFAAVHGQSLDGGIALIDFFLDREIRFWDQCKPVRVSSRAFAQAAAIVTGAGGADDRKAACRLIRQAPLMREHPEDEIHQVAEALRGLYPGPRWLNPVQPDLAGERLVGRVMAGQV